MTDYPCLQDSATVRQIITSAGYEASLILDPDSSNAITEDASGLSVRYGVGHAARISQSTNQALNQGSPNATSLVFNTIRFDTIGSITATANSLTTDVAGLWLVGAHVGLTMATYFSLNWQIAITSTAPQGVIAQEWAYTGNALYSPGVAETGIITANPCTVVELPAGTLMGVVASFDYGAVMITAPVATGSSSPPTAVAARNEMAGTEFFCALLRQYEV